jgi:hypothetical protein
VSEVLTGLAIDDDLPVLLPDQIDGGKGVSRRESGADSRLRGRTRQTGFSSQGVVGDEKPDEVGRQASSLAKSS